MQSPPPIPPTPPPTTKRKQPCPKMEAKLLKKVKKEVADFELIKKANTERFNEMSKSNSTNASATIFTPPDMKKVLLDDENNLEKTIFTIGDFVRVQPDTSPGKNRESGVGFITDLVQNDESGVFASVKYNIDGHIEKRIPVSDLHITSIQTFFSNEKNDKRRIVSKKKHASVEKLKIDSRNVSSIETLR